MSVLSRLNKAVFAATRRVRGATVLYARASDSISIEISAVRGSTNWNTDAPFAGSRIGDRSTDWLIATADLVDDAGNQLEPQRGDTITTGRGEVFRVMPFLKDSPLWQWHDRDGQTTRRIHTKVRS